jgi:hypothetical protein
MSPVFFHTTAAISPENPGEEMKWHQRGANALQLIVLEPVK